MTAIPAGRPATDHPPLDNPTTKRLRQIAEILIEAADSADAFEFRVERDAANLLKELRRLEHPEKLLPTSWAAHDAADALDQCGRWLIATAEKVRDAIARADATETPDGAKATIRQSIDEMLADAQKQLRRLPGTMPKVREARREEREEYHLRLLESHSTPAAVAARIDASTKHLQGLADAILAKRSAIHIGDEFPRYLLNGPSLVAGFGRWILETSPMPQPGFALASSIATIGALLGRRVEYSSKFGPQRTNFFLMGIGPSSCGKDAGLTIPESALCQGGLDRWIGPGKWMSSTSLNTYLKSNPAQVCYFDEFAKRLRRLSSKNASHHLAEIIDELLKLYSMAAKTWRPLAYADRKTNPPEPIVEPHLCFYGVGTPNDFFQAIQGESVLDGWLGRFLIVFAEDVKRQPEDVSLEDFTTHATIQEADGTREVTIQRSTTTVPADILGRLRSLEQETRPQGGDLAGTGSSTASGCRSMRITTAGAEQMARVLREHQWRINEFARQKDDVFAALWGKFPEHFTRLSLLHAASRDPHGSIDAGDVLWGYTFAFWCLRRVHLECLDYLSENETEARKKRVLRCITEKAGSDGWVSMSSITRSTQWLGDRERKDILGDLVVAGQLEVHRAAATEGMGRPPSHYRATGATRDTTTIGKLLQPHPDYMLDDFLAWREDLLAEG